MKHLAVLLILITTTAIHGSAMANDYQLHRLPAFDQDNAAASTAATATIYSDAIDMLPYYCHETRVAVQLVSTNSITNSGPMTISWQCSLDGAHWFAPTSGVAIATGFSQTNSPAGDGWGFWQFDPGLSRFVRLKCVVSSTNAITTGDFLIK